MHLVTGTGGGGVKTWLASCCHCVSIWTQVLFNFFLLYKPLPNDGSQVLSLIFPDWAPAVRTQPCFRTAWVG